MLLVYTLPVHMAVLGIGSRFCSGVWSFLSACASVASTPAAAAAAAAFCLLFLNATVPSACSSPDKTVIESQLVF